MNQPSVDSILDRARSLCAEVMELHILSVRMGAGSTRIEDYECSAKIISDSVTLHDEIERLKPDDR